MPINMIYRKAEPSDAGKILEYLKRVGGESDNLTFGAEGITSSISQEADFIRKISGNPKEILLLAFDEGELVGNAAISMAFNRERISHRRNFAISVRKDYWGKGIGSKLMEMLIDFCRETGGEIAELEVRSDNERGIALYKKFGFKKIGCHPAFMKISGEDISIDYMILDLK